MWTTIGVLLAMGTLQTVWAGPPYIFTKDLKCENAKGQEGYNERGEVPCSDFRRREMVWLTKSSTRIDLTGSNFEKRDLSSQILRKTMILAFTDFRSAHLPEARFEGTVLAGADLRGADLSHVVLRDHPNLTGAWIDEKTRLKSWTLWIPAETRGAAERAVHVSSADEVLGVVLAHNMIVWHPSKERGADREVLGGALQRVLWSEEENQGSAVLNLFVRRESVIIDDQEVYDQAKALELEPLKLFPMSVDPAWTKSAKRHFIRRQALAMQQVKSAHVASKKVIAAYYEDDDKKKHLVAVYPLSRR